MPHKYPGKGERMKTNHGKKGKMSAASYAKMDKKKGKKKTGKKKSGGMSYT